MRKARSVSDKLKEMKLSSAAKKVQEEIEESADLYGLSYPALDEDLGPTIP